MAEARSLDDRIAAAVAWLITGNTEEAGRLCNIPGRTIRGWMKEEWWPALLEEAKTEKQAELDAVWTSLIHLSATKLKDRIEKGDPVTTKGGDIVYIPVKARDLAVITSTLTDKRALARGQVTSRTERKSTGAEKLADLQKIKENLKDTDTDEKALH